MRLCEHLRPQAVNTRRHADDQRPRVPELWSAPPEKYPPHPRQRDRERDQVPAVRRAGQRAAGLEPRMADAGSGRYRDRIPADDLPHIWDEFFRRATPASASETAPVWAGDNRQATCRETTGGQSGPQRRSKGTTFAIQLSATPHRKPRRLTFRRPLARRMNQNPQRDWLRVLGSTEV